MRCAFSWATRPATATGCGHGNGNAGHHAGGDIACAVAAPNAVRLLLGDVMGHDDRAARTAVEVTRAFRQLAAHEEPLQVVAARLHAFVADHADGEEFVTAQFVSLPNGDDDEAQIVCCGHPPPLLLRDGATVIPPMPEGILLGALGDARYGEQTLQLQSGDILLLYTDGLIERRDRDIEESLNDLVGLVKPAVGTLEEQLEYLLLHSNADTDDDTCLIGVRVR